MMRAGLLCAAAVLAAVSAACSSGANAQEFGRSDAESIRKVIQDFSAAYNQKNADATAGFFSGSGVLMPPNSSAIRGTDSIRSFYEIRFKQGASGLETDVSDVGGHGPLAFVTGTYSVRVQSDGQDTKDRGKFLWIVRNYGGRWRLDYQIWSSDLPVALQVAATE